MAVTNVVITFDLTNLFYSFYYHSCEISYISINITIKMIKPINLQSLVVINA